ncbi:MAG TPA: PQQ-binding-like beta-propeller repeat protein [Amycolatopsis sp.]|nr:PQQ-binding-like beta-propeller repeat protein [Amycolatopsis sp.]
MSKSVVKARPTKQHTRRPAARVVQREPSASTLVLALRGVVLALAAALLVAPWLPWQEHKTGWALLSQGGFADLTVAVVCVVPAAVAWACTLARRSRWAGATAAIVTGIGTVAVFSELSGGPQWPGTGLGMAVMAFPALLLAGIPVAVTADRRVPQRVRPAPAATVIVVAVLAVAGVSYGGTWYAGRDLTSTTATASGADSPAGPAGRVLWSTMSGLDTTAIMLPGGLVAVRNLAGADISVRDSATGAERWQYTRRGASLSDLVLSGDGRTLVAVYTVKDHVAVGLDAATGTIRWQQAFGDTFLPLSAALVHLDGNGFTAYDPGTGRPGWHLPLTQQFCGNTGSIAADAGLLVALAPCVSLPNTKSGDVIAVDAEGRIRWTTPTQGQAQDSSSGQIALVSTDAIVASTGSQAFVLDPATGRVRWTVDPTVDTIQAVGDTVALTSANGRVTLRDAMTGRPTAAQPPADLVPAASSVADAAMLDGRAYILLTGARLHLAVVDLASGRILGDYVLPGAANASSGTVRVSPTGAAVVTAQSGNSTTVTAVAARG